MLLLWFFFGFVVFKKSLTPPFLSAVNAKHADTYPRVIGTQQQQLQQRNVTSSTLRPHHPQSTGYSKKGRPRSQGVDGGVREEEEDYEEPLYDSVASDDESNVDAVSLGTVGKV